MMRTIATTAGLPLPGSVAMAESTDDRLGGISAAAGDPTVFDIGHARITPDGRVATFHMAVSGLAGKSRPAATGALVGSQALAHVWPTTLDPAATGSEAAAGIPAMVATPHPDFDGTPLHDENRDGVRGNDGDLWHSQWDVPGPDDACGAGALKVFDIPDGAMPNLPATWPGLPLLLESPGSQPLMDGDAVEITVAFADIGVFEATGFDGVTAGLRVNANAQAPLLCFTDVFDVASGDLSLPGRVNQ